MHARLFWDNTMVLLSLLFLLLQTRARMKGVEDVVDVVL
jgi:hypothetical protein